MPSFSRQKETVEGALFDHFYIAEYRQHDGYDESLKTAYNFGFEDSATPDKVEFHPYMEGLLVWYWDTQYTDNNVGDHPGHGELLPVDAHPNFNHWPNGDLMRNRIQSYDSTFGLKPDPGADPAQEQVRRRGRVRGDHDRDRRVPAWRARFRRHPAVVVPDRPRTPSTACTPVATSRRGTASTCPRPGSTIRVNGFGKKGDQINLTVN